MIYSIQRYCIHDGNGIRTTVFFKGCQLRCPWCANPESQSPHVQLGYLAHKCIDCGKCEQICPKHAILRHQINYGLCDGCGLCSYYCPEDALPIYGEALSPEQLAFELLKDNVFYEKSGGGVTFSGGEATLQEEYLLKTASILHQEGIHTALESNGLFSERLCQRLPQAIDQFLIDLKHLDDSCHREVLGISNTGIIKNLTTLSDQDLIIRLPVIPGFNDSDTNLRQTAQFARQLNVPLQLLGFHNMGTAKYHALNLPYAYESIPSMSILQLEEKKNICREEWEYIL